MPNFLRDVLIEWDCYKKNFFLMCKNEYLSGEKMIRERRRWLEGKSWSLVILIDRSSRTIRESGSMLI